MIDDYIVYYIYNKNDNIDELLKIFKKNKIICQNNLLLNNILDITENNIFIFYEHFTWIYDINKIKIIIENIININLDIIIFDFDLHHSHISNKLNNNIYKVENIESSNAFVVKKHYLQKCESYDKLFTNNIYCVIPKIINYNSNDNFMFAIKNNNTISYYDNINYEIVDNLDNDLQIINYMFDKHNYLNYICIIKNLNVNNINIIEIYQLLEIMCKNKLEYIYDSNFPFISLIINKTYNLLSYAIPNLNLLYKHSIDDIHIFNIIDEFDSSLNLSNYLNKLNFKYEIITMSNKKYNITNYALLHLECLKNAKQKNYLYCMICENNIELNISENEFKIYLTNFLNDDNLKILCITYYIPKKETIKQYNESFDTATNIQTTTCYIVKYTYYDKLISMFESSTQILYDKYIINTEILNKEWKQLQNNDLWIIPHLSIEKKYINNLNNKYCIILLQGGLGNRLFQISATYSIAKKQNKLLLISELSLNEHSNIDYKKNIFNKLIFCNKLPINSFIIFENNEPLPFIDIPNYEFNNLLIYGYFQNEKYFIDYKDEIIKLFEIEQERLLYLTNKYKNLKNSCFIHIRRGDYLKFSDIYYFDLKLYYEKCIKIMQEKYNNCLFCIFSDDIEYCKNYKTFKSINAIFIEDENELNSLYLMSLCHLGGICTNSTFSWWGAYLNKNNDKTVIFPNKWFNSIFINIDIGFKSSIIVSID